MSNADIREAHKLLDSLFDNSELSHAQIDLIRGLVPELPKQKTLEEITEHVRNAWVGASGNEWAGNSYNTEITLESWMGELYVQLQGLADAVPAKPAHSEFLETEAGYAAAPEGTIAACEDSLPWYKFDSTWLSTVAYGVNSDKDMSNITRRVLRWGWGE